MKLVKKQIGADGSGSMILLVEHPDDLWNVYNMIREGDQVKAKTYRKVQKERETGGTSSERKQINMTLAVRSTEYAPGDGELRVGGQNMTESQWVQKGQHHTLVLCQHKQFTLTKAHWDDIDVERIQQACDPKRDADVGAVVLQEGLANVCLLTPMQTLVLQKIELNIPKKRSVWSVEAHGKALDKFYMSVIEAMDRHLPYEQLKCLLLCSPGFVRDKLFSMYYEHVATLSSDKPSIPKERVVKVGTSSGFLSGLSEALRRPEIQSQLKDTKAAGETNLMEAFYELMNKQPDKTVYGVKVVLAAHDLGAIEKLLILDELLRTNDIQERQRWVSLVDDVRKQTGKREAVSIMSGQHTSGEQLKQLGNIAAELRFPCPQLDEMDSDSDSSSSDDDSDSE